MKPALTARTPCPAAAEARDLRAAESAPRVTQHRCCRIAHVSAARDTANAPHQSVCEQRTAHSEGGAREAKGVA
eukprot:3941292-Rhodomonas_salina.4